MFQTRDGALNITWIFVVCTSLFEWQFILMGC